MIGASTQVCAATPSAIGRTCLMGRVAADVRTAWALAVSCAFAHSLDPCYGLSSSSPNSPSSLPILVRRGNKDGHFVGSKEQVFRVHFGEIQ